MARRFFNITSAQNAVARHNDHSAFEFLFDVFYDKLLRIAIYYFGKELIAEDAIADVFCKLWDSREKLQKVENLENYLFTMVKNQCLYILRSNKKVIYDEKMMDDNQRIIIENPESNLISEEFITYYNNKIQELPPKCKLVYLMVKEDGMKYKEVAEILNISVKTVENQMTKAIAHVRKCVNAYQAYHKKSDQSENIQDF
jgi:RNA polymerase sigma-70 factor (ECF subfamily)